MNGETVHALRGVSLQVDQGEYVAIVGPSGSGKSTLLQLLGGIDTPSSGSVEVLGTRLDALGDTELTRLRLTRLGFIFQRFHLLPVLTARENVELPMAEAGPRAARQARAGAAGFRRPGQRGTTGRLSSGGEMQRVAIARRSPTGRRSPRTSPPVSSMRPPARDPYPVPEAQPRRRHAGG
jgi:ABC-type lipoprotein export system ATPase subunit